MRRRSHGGTAGCKPDGPKGLQGVRFPPDALRGWFPGNGVEKWGRNGFDVEVKEIVACPGWSDGRVINQTDNSCER
jgi:hypothetical protein